MHSAELDPLEEGAEVLDPTPRLDERGVRVKWTKRVQVDFVPELGHTNLVKYLSKHEFSVLVDVRDGRMPKTAAHPAFRTMQRHAKSHIIVYTHCDMLNDTDVAKLLVWSQRVYGHCAIFCLDLSGADVVREKHFEETQLSVMKDCLTEACRTAGDRSALTYGLPNVGKSSFILPLVRDIHKRRRKKGEFHNPKVSSEVGQTKGTSPHLFIELEKPKMVAHWGYHPVTSGYYLIDTPGFPLSPQVYFSEPETYFKMFALNKVTKSAEHRAFDLADFMLWKCNRLQRYIYVDLFQLKGPTDNIHEVLDTIDASRSPFVREKAAELFCEKMFKGGFQRLMLDELDLTEEEERRTEEVVLAYEADQVVLATNWTPGFFERPIIRLKHGVMRRATPEEARRHRAATGQ